MPRPDAPPTSLVTFTGTLQPLKTNTHTFSVAQSGYVFVTLLALDAPPGTTVQLAIGTPATDGSCTAAYSVNTGPGPTAQMSGTGLAGTLCVAITDTGQLAAPALYTITVATS